jgi:Flp pilus assembly protein TadB
VPLEAGLALASAAIAAAVFGLPLLGAHRLLVAEKEARLAEASSRFEAAAIELHSQLEQRRLAQMDQLNKALSSLEIEQNALRKIPTWPWQPGAIRAVVAALLLPLAIWILQQLLARFLPV